MIRVIFILIGFTLFQQVAQPAQDADSLEKDWVAYVKSVDANGASVSFLAKRFLPAMENAPDAVGKRVLEAITPLYGAARRVRLKNADGINTEKKGEWLPAKRAFDFMVQVLLPAKKIVEEELGSGKSFPDAVNQYIRRVHSAVRPESPAYGYEDVLDVTLSLQRWLASLPALPNKEKKAILFGSFPKGAADLKTSDIDLYLPIKEIETATGQTREILLERLTKEIQTKIQQRLHLTSAAIYLSFGGKKELDWMDVPSPLVVEITPSTIIFSFFPPLVRHTSEAKSIRFIRDADGSYHELKTCQNALLR